MSPRNKLVDNSSIHEFIKLEHSSITTTIANIHVYVQL
jgi:hypothetical protein